MTMPWILIEVCDANPADSPRLYDLEATFPAVSVIESSCISECELCARNPFVLLNGEIVADTDVSALITKLEQRIGDMIRKD